MSTDNEDNKSNGGKLAGFSIGFIILILLSRAVGPLTRFKSNLDRDARERAAQDEIVQRQNAEASKAMNRFFENLNGFRSVEALQGEFKLSDEDFESLLQAEWTATHSESEIEPWRVSIGDTGPYWWRGRQKWNIESVRRRCAAAAASSPEAAKVEGGNSPGL